MLNSSLLLVKCWLVPTCSSFFYLFTLLVVGTSHSFKAELTVF